MKKVITLISAILMLGFFGTAAYAYNAYEQDFEKYSVGSWITGYTYPRGHSISVQEENGNKYGAIELNMADSQGSPYSDINIPRYERQNIVFECSVKTSDNNGKASCYIFLYDENRKYFVPVKIIGNNLYTDNGKRLLTVVEDNRFYQVTVRMDMTSRKYDVMLEGELVAENLSMGSFTGSYIKRIQPCVQEIKSGCSDLKFGFDNFVVKNGLGSTVFYANAGKYKSGDEVLSLDERLIHKNDTVYFPVSEAGAVFGAELSEGQNTVTVECNSVKTDFTVNSGKVISNGVERTVKYPPLMYNNKIYIQVRDMCEACGYECSIDSTGAVIVEKNASELSWDNIWNYYAENSLNMNPKKAEMLSTIEELILVSPAKSDILNDFTNTKAGHPRVLADSATFAGLHDKYSIDSEVKKAVDRIISFADIFVNTSQRPYAKYGMTDDVRMLSPIYDCGNTVITCAFAWQYTHDEKYAQRAWKEIEYFCNDSAWPDWNPYQMLGIGEAMYNCAIAYDWLYDYLNETQKAEIRRALQDKAWRHYWNDINGVSYKDADGKRDHCPYVSADEELERSLIWRELQRNNNWSFVIHGGAVMSAVAVFDEMPDEASEMISVAVDDCVNAFEGFAPDGAWFEGSSYWGYSIEFAANMLSTLEVALGSDYGLGDMPGMRSTGGYMFAMLGPGGTFNFSDSDESFRPTAEMFYLAGRHKDGALFKRTYDYYVSNRIQLGYNPLTAITSENPASMSKSVLWYSSFNSQEQNILKKDYYFRDVETATLRSSYLDNANFIGIHGGKNDDPHSHVDSGTFVLDYEGERFAMDLGKDNYDISGGNYRYRYNVQGHNCIVFDPETLEESQNASNNFSGGQVRWNNAKITKFGSGTGTAFAVCDLSDTYPNVSSYLRGVKLTNNRNEFVIRDEFTLNKVAQDMYWFMHTDAEIVLSSDRRSAVLTKNGKSLTVKILSAGGEFEILPAKGLPGTAVAYYDGQDGAYSNDGVQKLSIHLKNLNTGSYVISVGAGADVQDSLAAEPIADWEIDSEEEEPFLTDLKINGSSIEGFSRYIYEYTVNMTDIPDITTDSKYDVSVFKPDSLNSKAYIFVNNTAGTVVYTVDIISDTLPDTNDYISINNRVLQGGGSDIASSEEVTYDLRQVLRISGLVADMDKEGPISISVSEDGIVYYPVYTGVSHIGKTLYAEGNYTARYIRVKANGIAAINDMLINTLDIKNYDFVVASFDNMERMTSAKKFSVKGLAGDSFDLSKMVGDEDAVVKVFLWDENTLRPIQNAKTIVKID